MNAHQKAVANVAMPKIEGEEELPIPSVKRTKGSSFRSWISKLTYFFSLGIGDRTEKGECFDRLMRRVADNQMLDMKTDYWTFSEDNGKKKQKELEQQLEHRHIEKVLLENEIYLMEKHLGLYTEAVDGFANLIEFEKYMRSQGTNNKGDYVSYSDRLDVYRDFNNAYSLSSPVEQKALENQQGEML